MTPVKKGQARGNWQVSVNTVIDQDIERFDENGGATVLAEQPTIAAAEPYSVIWLNNALPYINRLEHGYSKQAPAGMVSVTYSRLKAIFEG